MPPNSGAPRTLTEGERWAREQLDQLRKRRFGPAAVAGFLGDSWRRAADVRAARPQLARRGYAWGAIGAAGWLALAIAGVEPFRRRLGAGLAWWAATALMLDWHLGMFESEDGRARELGAADGLTLARAWLVPVAADSPTPLVCAAAAVSDALDGRLARRTEPTRAGRDLEGLVDFCFVAAALRGLLRRGQLGRVTALAEGARMGLGFGYALAVYFGRARAPDAHLMGAARATTAIRYGALLAAGAGRRGLADRLLAGATAASVALLVGARGRRRA